MKSGKFNLGCIFMIADVCLSFYCFKATFAPNSMNPQYFSAKASCRECTACVCLCGVEAREAVSRTKHNNTTISSQHRCCEGIYTQEPICWCCCILMYSFMIYLYFVCFCHFTLLILVFLTFYPRCCAPGFRLSQRELLEGMNEVLSNLI